MKPRSFQTRVIAVMIAVVVAAQLATFAVVTVATQRAVSSRLEQELHVGQRVWEQFQQSRQFWSTLVEEGALDAPSTFINSTPHMTFVRGEKDVAFLKARYEAPLQEIFR